MKFSGRTIRSEDEFTLAQLVQLIALYCNPIVIAFAGQHGRSTMARRLLVQCNSFSLRELHYCTVKKS